MTSSSTSPASAARSHLYVPGDQPRMLARAAERGADALIIDLEDAVAASAKDQARRTVSAWLDGISGPPAAEIWLRINPAGPAGEPPAADLAVIHPLITGIVQAKCQSPEALARLDESLAEAEQRIGAPAGTVRVAALVESPARVVALSALAAAPRVTRLQAGEADLAAALGMRPGPDAAEFMPLRWSLVVTSAAAGIAPPVGPVYTGLADLDGLRRTTIALRRMGFSGRAALHPSQIPVINEVFTPTADEVSAAADVLARFEDSARSGSGAVLGPDGRFVDAAVAASARNVIDQHGTPRRSR